MSERTTSTRYFPTHNGNPLGNHRSSGNGLSRTLEQYYSNACSKHATTATRPKSQLEIFNTGKLFGRVEKLEADVDRLREPSIMNLTTKNVELTFENKQLKEENQQLRDDNKELHEKIEKLEMQVQQLIDQAGE
jgi:predicted nuclease with TOPRIM domain